MPLRDHPNIPEAPVKPDELERLARKYNTSVANVAEVIKQIHAIARVEIEAALQARASTPQDREMEYLARKHGTTVEAVKKIAREIGSRSMEQIEAALEKRLSINPLFRDRFPAKRT